MYVALSEFTTGPRTFTIPNGSINGDQLFLFNNSNFLLTNTMGLSSTGFFYGSGLNGFATFPLNPGQGALLQWSAASGNWYVPFYSAAYLQSANIQPPLQATSAIGVSIGANYSGTISVSFTAPSNGWVTAIASLNLSGNPAANIHSIVSVDATNVGGDNNQNPQSYPCTPVFVGAGASVTVVMQVTTTTSPATLGTYRLLVFFSATA